ncbi:MAG: holin family protein [Pseudomonadota bacterium]
MGLIERMLTLVFGGSTNVVRETVEVFRENAEAGAKRNTRMQGQAMQQFGQEFLVPRQGWFDRFMDGLNRLPRPALALGTLGLFISAMVHPIWFAERMQGIALVPEPLWWLLGVIVSFYFGARHQVKAQQFQREIAGTVARVPDVLRNLEAIDAAQKAMPSGVNGDADVAPEELTPEPAAEPKAVLLPPVTAVRAEGNAALEDWLRERG